MNSQFSRVRELAAWGLDDYRYRPVAMDLTPLLKATNPAAQRSPFVQTNPVMEPLPQELSELFRLKAQRPDLLYEMSGLTWSLGLIDLRALIAFQRRLAFSASLMNPAVPAREDWRGLFALSFAAPRQLEIELDRKQAPRSFVLRTSNPDLHLRVTGDTPFTLAAHASGPFLEVASFRGRWFLRDGYHRAYRLLQAQVFAVPAVIVHAATIEELGANQPWFFPEDVLFSVSPPLVADFLSENLVIEYERPQLIKTLRITVTEELSPATESGEQL